MIDSVGYVFLSRDNKRPLLNAIALLAIRAITTGVALWVLETLIYAIMIYMYNVLDLSCSAEEMIGSIFKCQIN